MLKALPLIVLLCGCSLLDSAEDEAAKVKIPKAHMSTAIVVFKTWLDGLAVDSDGNITGDTMVYALPSLWKQIRDAYGDE